MPEKPEVITVAKKLKVKLESLKFVGVDVYHNNIIEYPTVDEFKSQIVGQEIHDITTRGKWIVFLLDDFYLLVHLRMEGKFFYRTREDAITKHEHVVFTLSNDTELRFADVRKFGKMLLIPKDEINNRKPFTELGLEAWDKLLTSNYLREKYQRKTLPIKSVILDQSIITGVGNIYADEILFLSHINPLTRATDLNDDQLQAIIKNTVSVLDKAIAEGGTTIRSYTSEEGVTGLFQNSLNVHAKEKEPCPICGTAIIKIKVGGRGTYYCLNCQK